MKTIKLCLVTDSKSRAIFNAISGAFFQPVAISAYGASILFLTFRYIVVLELHHNSFMDDFCENRTRILAKITTQK